MRRLRIYVDTSVMGGCFDEKYAEESQALLNLFFDRLAVMIVSDLLVEELVLAPEEVQKTFASLPAECLETIRMTEESEQLCNAYIKAGVVTDRHSNDAHHVALATIARADLIVSWNFKHIVHFDKIRGFNAVNLKEGYPQIDIRAPKEVI